jgi:hypothetical protein
MGDLEMGWCGKWNWECGLRPGEAIGAYAPEGSRNKKRNAGATFCLCSRFSSSSIGRPSSRNGKIKPPG